MKTWEHYVICTAVGLDLDLEETQKTLDKMGREGWELVTVTQGPQSPAERTLCTLFFKRDINPVEGTGGREVS